MENLIKKKFRFRLEWQLVFLLFLILLYILYFSGVTILRHHNLYSGRYDLGDMDQTVWNSIHGRLFQMGDPESDSIVSRFTYHGDILLVLISPLYLIYESPYTLLVLQSIVMGLGALPLYLLGKKILSNKTLALVVSFSYLLYAPLQRANIYDFHAVTFCVPFFLTAFYFLYDKKYWWAFFFCLLAMLTKEEIGFIVFMIGLYVAVRQHNRNWGVWFIVTGLLTSYIFIWLIIPHFRPPGDAHFALIFYSKYGDTPSKILKGVFLHPLDIVQSVFDYSSIVYLYELLIPVGFLSIFSLDTVLLSISEIAINILSNNYFMKTIYLQYTSAIIPFIFISYLFGIRFLIVRYQGFYEKGVKRFLKVDFSFLIILFIFAFALFGNYNEGVLPLDNGYPTYLLTPKTGTAVVNEIQSEIPKRYSISASNSISPHFTERKYTYTFPVKANSADFIIVLKNETFEIVDKAVFDQTLDYELQNPKYKLVYNDGDFYILQKKSIKNFILHI